MGMTIDDAINYYSNKNVVLTEEEAEANTIALNTMRKYQKLQADYENRLKADLEAILVDLQLEIEEIEKPLCHSATYAKGCVDKGRIEGLIQQKINSLKEAK